MIYMNLKYMLKYFLNDKIMNTELVFFTMENFE